LRRLSDAGFARKRPEVRGQRSERVAFRSAKAIEVKAIILLIKTFRGAKSYLHSDF
jgi:hypothetical protein